MVDCCCILIIFRTQGEVVHTFICSLSSHALFIYILKHSEEKVRQEVKVVFVYTETQCVHCWLKSCSR